MMIPPIIMSKLEPTAAFVKNPWLKVREYTHCYHPLGM
jgi:hypothetical protein